MQNKLFRSIRCHERYGERNQVSSARKAKKLLPRFTLTNRRLYVLCTYSKVLNSRCELQAQVNNLTQKPRKHNDVMHQLHCQTHSHTSHITHITHKMHFYLALFALISSNLVSFKVS